MASSLYDSRSFVKRLTEAGLTKGVADVLASENLLLIAEHLATKDDLHNAVEGLRSEMLAGFSNVQATVDVEFATLRKEMADLENRLLLKLGGFFGVLFTVFEFLN